MRRTALWSYLIVCVLMLVNANVSMAQPAPQRGEAVIKDFRFGTGEVLPELKLGYQTVGAPTGVPVLVLHGSSGSSQSMLGKNFAGELFGPGQPLDASKYFLILPDSIGAGRSSKPSNGMRTKFPKFTYEDQGDGAVSAGDRAPRHPPPQARDRPVDGRHARLDLGLQISGLHGGAGADGLAADRHGRAQLDPAPHDDRDDQGRSGLQQRELHRAAAELQTTPRPSSGWRPGAARSRCTSRRRRRRRPTRSCRIGWRQRFTADANDYIYAYDAARDYDPSPHLEKIKARVLAINAADDERNPIELGILPARDQAREERTLFRDPGHRQRRAVTARRATQSIGNNCCPHC